MPERFIIRTVLKTASSVLADYYETTIHDQQAGTIVSCAGNTPQESRTNAEAYLAVLNHLKKLRLDAGRRITQ